MTLVGDVEGKTAVIVDDMADTCGTLAKAAEVCIQNGAKDAVAIVTHGVLSGNAIETLNKSKLVKVVVTNTVPHEEKKLQCSKIETIDISSTVSQFFPWIMVLLSIFSWLRRVGERIMARVSHICSNMHPRTRFITSLKVTERIQWISRVQKTISYRY
jgi:hypothetical protein